MKSLLFRMLQFLALAGLLSSTSPAADEVAWPGVEFTTVKAYLFGGDASSSLILEDGKLTTSIEKVARLSAEQIRRVPTVIEPEPPNTLRAKCYEPHHAIVYFDEFGHPVAFIEVCYRCNNYRCNPPLPKSKVVILEKLLPLFKELGIPTPGDKEFAQLMKLEEAARETPVMKAIYGYFDDKTPESAKVWPWRDVETVKVMELNATSREPLVHLGQVTKAVVREATLTASQKEEACKCIAGSEWGPKDAKLEVKYDTGGEMWVRPIGSKVEQGFKWKHGEPTLPRHGLVCFDKAGRPFAWLTISFSDGTYTAYPNEGPANVLSRFWHIAPLQKVFEQAGVFNPAEYQKLVEQTQRGETK